MSDAVDDGEVDARRLLNRVKTRSIREQMREFASEHGEEPEFKSLRDEVASGQDLSETVRESRDERL